MNKLLIILAAVAFGVFAATKSVEAYRGDPAIQGPYYSEEKHEQIEKAFDTNNYNLWKSLMGDRRGRVLQVVNKDNFAKFATAHKLAEQGKTAEAQKIRNELGLGLQNGQGYNR